MWLGAMLKGPTAVYISSWLNRGSTLPQFMQHYNIKAVPVAMASGEGAIAGATHLSEGKGAGGVSALIPWQ